MNRIKKYELIFKKNNEGNNHIAKNEIINEIEDFSYILLLNSLKLYASSQEKKEMKFEIVKGNSNFKLKIGDNNYLKDTFKSNLLIIEKK